MKGRHPWRGEFLREKGFKLKPIDDKKSIVVKIGEIICLYKVKEEREWRNLWHKEFT